MAVSKVWVAGADLVMGYIAGRKKAAQGGKPLDIEK
jgi:hypothetical protein